MFNSTQTGAVFLCLNKNFHNSQSKNMAILACFVVVELVIFLMILPFETTLKINFSLDRQQCLIRAKIFGFSPFKIKIEKSKDRFRMLINGKIYDNKTNKFSLDKVREKMDKILSFVRQINAVVLVGGSDASTAGRNCGFALSVLSTLTVVADSKIFPVFEKDRFVLDAEIAMKLTLLDVIGLVKLWK